MVFICEKNQGPLKSQNLNCMSWRFFKYDEFDCSHCGKNWTDKLLIDKLDALRAELGMPIKITSGYRCEEHNQTIGGVKYSQHVLGKAADIASQDLDKLYELAQKYFKAVGDGRHKGFIHVDLRSEKIRRWTY